MSYVTATKYPASTVGACSACGYGHGPYDGEVWDIRLGEGQSASLRLCASCMNALVSQVAQKGKRARRKATARPWSGFRLNAYGKPDVTTIRGGFEPSALPPEEQERRHAAWFAGHIHCSTRFGAGQETKWDDSDWTAAVDRYRELGGDPSAA